MLPPLDGAVAPLRTLGTGAGVVDPGPVVGVVDLATVGELPPAYRAVGSFVLVLLAGVALLARSQGFVEGSIDASLARPHVSALYGVVGYGIVGFLGFLGLTQLSYVGLSTGLVGSVLIGLVLLAVLVLAGLGYTVVGSGLLELAGARQPWNGLVLGAAISAVAWLVLPPLAAAAVWTLVAAVGIGGPVREWMHAERTKATESGS